MATNSTTPAAQAPRVSSARQAVTDATVSGSTTVVDPVVAKIAGIAAREVPGVHDLGRGATRVVGAVRDAIGQTDLGQGVSVEVGERQVAADVTIVVAYPQPLHIVAENVRKAVASAITDLVGLEVAEINVTVADVHIEGEGDEPEETRVA